MKRLIYCSFVVMVAAATAFAQDVPQWAKDAVGSTVPPFGPKTPAAVLLNEERVVVEADGRITRTKHHVLRVLSREGRDRVVARSTYLTDSEKVRTLTGWLLRASKPAKKYETALDVAAVNNDVYNEIRSKVISASDEAEPGAVFAYEAVTEARSIFTQLDWAFQNDLPVVTSRLVLTLPTGWTARSFTFNHSTVDPMVTGSTYVWELRALPPVEFEPAMPGTNQVVPRLAVSFFPPIGRSGPAGPSFASWSEVSQWLAQLNEPQAALTPTIGAEAMRLTAGAQSDLDKIRAIGRYVQSIQYISIQTGIGRGGGYKPHTAAQIMDKSYGDCKDKVTLMRSLLGAVGIASFPISIYSGDALYVREEWPSPQQFNHAIIGIRVKDTAVESASLEYAPLGSLLLFDPTDPFTSVGDLPEQLQGSFALIVASEKGGLIRVPSVPPDRSQLLRQADVTLSPEGNVTAAMEETSSGQAAAHLRAEFRALSMVDFIKMVERWVANTVTGATISKVEPIQKADDTFTLKADFRANRYGQVIGNKLLVFKPAIVNRRNSISFSEATRKYPIVFRAIGYTDIIRVKLPDDFRVDEMPEPITLETGFGKYTAKCEITESGILVFTRSLSIQSTIIPAEKYPEVRSFFQKMTSADSSAVVLVKK